MLMYHAVRAGRTRPDWPWAVSMHQFKSQLDFLAGEGYATPTMAELVASPQKWAGRRVAVLTFDDGYVDNLYACEALTSRGLRASFFIVAGALGRDPHWAADGRPRGRLLNATELRLMHNDGMEIGSHTVNHVRLTETGEAQLHHELADSKARLEDALGSPVTSFAYPYGAWDDRCVEAVKRVGYAAACTTRTGWAQRDGDPYRLRRLSVMNTDTTSSLARKLAFADNAVGWRQLAGYAHRRVAAQAGSRFK